MELNERQQKALGVLDRAPLRVIAGPGTGKTATVVEMYLRLVVDLGYDPSNVLVLTFSKNAAEELRRRVDSRYREPYSESWISTFHSFAYRILRDYVESPPSSLMNGFQEKLLMRHVLRQLRQTVFAARTAASNGLAPLLDSESLVGDALWLVGTLKQELMRPEDFRAWVTEASRAHSASASRADRRNESPNDIEKLKDLAVIYEAYFAEQERLRLQDFRDVIADLVKHLQAGTGLAQRLAAKFRYVIVDEYQDVDPAQVQMLDLLTRDHGGFRHLAVVGDPDQSIYSFRGTSPFFIQKDFPERFGGETVRLDRNYRSVAQVLEAGERLRDTFTHSHPGDETLGDSTLSTTREALIADRGPAVWAAIQLRREETSADEAAGVARRILQLTKAVEDGGSGYSYRDIAVILRSVNRSGRPFEEALQAAGIPHAAGLSPHFADSQVVRFGVAALRSLSDIDDDNELAHVLASPFCGVPVPDAARLLDEAKRRRRALRQTLKTTSLAKLLTWVGYLMTDEDAQRWPLPWGRGREEETSQSDPLTRVEDQVPAPVKSAVGDIRTQMDVADRLEAAEAFSSGDTVDLREPTSQSRPAQPDFYRLLSAEAKDAIHGFLHRWLRLRSVAQKVPVDVLAYRVFQDMGVMNLVMRDDSSVQLGNRGTEEKAPLTGRKNDLQSVERREPHQDEALGPLRMFLRAVTDFVAFQRPLLGREPTISEVLENLEPALREYVDELEPQDDAQGGSVRILTVHAAKGLEFPIVFFPAMVATRFPVLPKPRTPLLTEGEMLTLQQGLTSVLQRQQGGTAQPVTLLVSEDEFVREEGNLGFVAATRAKDLLVLSYADKYEDEDALPSAFLQPLAEGAINVEYSETHQPASFGDRSTTGQWRELADRWEPWSTRPVPVNHQFHDSASSLTNWLACPRKYYYSKVLGIGSEAGVQAARGTAFHDAMERFHDPKMEARWRQGDLDPATAYEECCRIAIEDHLLLIDGELEKLAERSLLKRLFQNYWESEHDSWDELRTQAVERNFYWRLPDERLVIGRIDRIVTDGEGSPMVVDYKSGKGQAEGEILKKLGLVQADKRLSIDRETPPQDLQLLIYFFALNEGAELRPALGGDEPSQVVSAVSLWFPANLMGKKGQRRVRKVGLGDAKPGLKLTAFLDIDPIRQELRASLGRHFVDARSGWYEPAPRHDSYTCLSNWGTGCAYAWMCPGRIEEPEDWEDETA